MKKTTKLRRMLTRPGLDFVLEAHNGISSRIVEEAGFQGIWASGLAISASLGVRDNNEASWTQVLEVVEFMSDATTIPILLDGDTGYGNFNNARRLIRKLEQRNVAGARAKAVICRRKLWDWARVTCGSSARRPGSTISSIPWSAPTGC